MHPNKTFKMLRMVGGSSVGENGCLTLGAMVDYLQDCSTFHLDRLPDSKAYLKEHGLGMYLVSRQVDIRRMPKLGEELTVRSWIFDYNRSFENRNTVIYDKYDRPCICSYAIDVLVDLMTGKASMLPEPLISLPTGHKFEMEYLPRRINLPSENFEDMPTVAVRRYHIDYNHHVNNARYVSIASEFLPEGFEPKGLRIEYKKPARYGCIFYPRIAACDGSFFILLCDESQDIYAIIEFLV